jgi:hypothetical protein
MKDDRERGREGWNKLSCLGNLIYAVAPLNGLHLNPLKIR